MIGGNAHVSIYFCCDTEWSLRNKAWMNLWQMNKQRQYKITKNKQKTVSICLMLFVCFWTPPLASSSWKRSRSRCCFVWINSFAAQNIWCFPSCLCSVELTCFFCQILFVSCFQKKRLYRTAISASLWVRFSLFFCFFGTTKTKSKTKEEVFFKTKNEWSGNTTP